MQFVFYSHKSNQLETIEIGVSRVGWFIEHPNYSGTVFPNGTPHIQQYLQEHLTAYPPALGDAFEELWEAAVHDHLSDAEIQQSLDEFSQWVINFSMDKDAKHALDRKNQEQRKRSPA